MKRLVFLAIALLASSTIASAQEDAQTTTNTPQQSIQEQSSELKTEKPTKKRNNYFRRGYFGIVDGSVAAYYAGGLVGGIDIINGHNSDWFGIGIGVGCRAGIGVGCRAGMGKEVAIPIYVHLRAEILNRRVTPIILANIGYSYGFGEKPKYNETMGYTPASMVGSNFFAEAGIGLGIRVRQKGLISLSIMPSFFTKTSANGIKLGIGYKW